MKFDILPASDDAFALSKLGRRRFVVSKLPGREDFEFPIASPEDMLLAKMVWFRNGREASERQWSDILSIFRMQTSRLDGAYLNERAGKLGVGELLERARRAVV